MVAVGDRIHIVRQRVAEDGSEGRPKLRITPVVVQERRRIGLSEACRGDPRPPQSRHGRRIGRTVAPTEVAARLLVLGRLAGGQFLTERQAGAQRPRPHGKTAKPRLGQIGPALAGARLQRLQRLRQSERALVHPLPHRLQAVALLVLSPLTGAHAPLEREGNVGIERELDGRRGPRSGGASLPRGNGDTRNENERDEADEPTVRANHETPRSDRVEG